MPKFIGLIGYPIKHSISPYFQQVALDYYQLDIRYEAWETSPGTLEAAVAEMRAMYEKIIEEMGSEAMETEVPAEELSKEEPQKEELSSDVEEVEPIAHTPEAAVEDKKMVRFAANRPMSTLDRVFAQLNQIKK